jgi:hypothetical protein
MKAGTRVIVDTNDSFVGIVHTTASAVLVIAEGTQGKVIGDTTPEDMWPRVMVEFSFTFGKATIPVKVRDLAEVA